MYQVGYIPEYLVDDPRGSERLALAIAENWPLPQDITLRQQFMTASNLSQHAVAIVNSGRHRGYLYIDLKEAMLGVVIRDTPPANLAMIAARLMQEKNEPYLARQIRDGVSALPVYEDFESVAVQYNTHNPKAPHWVTGNTGAKDKLVTISVPAYSASEHDEVLATMKAQGYVHLRTDTYEPPHTMRTQKRYWQAVPLSPSFNYADVLRERLFAADNRVAILAAGHSKTGERRGYTLFSVLVAYDNMVVNVTKHVAAIIPKRENDIVIRDNKIAMLRPVKQPFAEFEIVATRRLAALISGIAWLGRYNVEYSVTK